MPRFYICLFLGTLILCGCNSYRYKYITNPCCRELYQLFQEGWVYNPEQKTFAFRQSVLEELKYPYLGFILIHQDMCMGNFSKQKVRKLLGEPSSEEENTFLYYRNEKCFQPGKDKCKFYIVIFDPTTEMMIGFKESSNNNIYSN